MGRWRRTLAVAFQSAAPGAMMRKLEEGNRERGEAINEMMRS